MTRAKPPVSPTTALVVVAILMLTLAVALLTCLRLPPLVGPPIRSSSLLHNGGEKKTAPHVDSLLSLTQIAAVGSVPLPGGPLLDAQHNIVDHSCVQFDVSEGMLTREAAAADLTANTSVSAEIEEDGYAYYQLCVAKHAHHHELIITLDSPQGDADLYCSSTIARPTLEHSTWISAGIGGEAVTLTTALDEWDPTSSALYLGIYGRTSAKYVLNVAIRMVTPPPPLRLRRVNS